MLNDPESKPVRYLRKSQSQPRPQLLNPAHLPVQRETTLKGGRKDVDTRQASFSGLIDGKRARRSSGSEPKAKKV